MSNGAESQNLDPGYPLGGPGQAVVHVGPQLKPRIVSVPTRHSVHEIDLPEGTDLVESIAGLLGSLGAEGLMVEFLAGEFGHISFVHPAYGPDAEHPMSFTSEFESPGPARLRHASATVGFKDGGPFSHIHASWDEEDGRIRGGHLLPGTLAGPTGLRLRVFALHDARLLSDHDPETGFSAFAPAPRATDGDSPNVDAAEVDAADASSDGGAADLPREFDAVISRVRPGEILDEAVVCVCRDARFDSAEVRASLGSTTGAVFTDGTAPWPAVEFTHLKGTVSGAMSDDPSVQLEGEVADVAGEIRSGQLAAGANPVAVTFELLVRRV
ncbi:DUF296 domain-containing protein [Brevibacterium sp. ZH18]|uniref:PCC domain-containing protein n=1 Tax=Brevibacterium sp. ZH18 TaxID=2927784 RepID=UPI001F608588|nr:DUF296 domain-containing protein [Brevibacterium sp. ZH18]MCI4010728.1 DNA-binding protein [Brevibacterium sp. ZH18]